jgi:endonuclease YncB( thermonuclease family)
MMHNGKIVNVVDGDTFDCIVDLDFNLTIKIRIRLYGVNCPEMDRKNPAGLAAKEFAQKMLIEKSIILNYLKHDSFGRCLCSVWIDNKDFAGILLSEGLAVPYHD